jgi:hypothetical protein
MKTVSELQVQYDEVCKVKNSMKKVFPGGSEWKEIHKVLREKEGAFNLDMLEAQVDKRLVGNYI